MRIFCQYNHGGYSTYRINGVSKEPLQEVVPSDTPDGFPTLADIYFSFGGVRILYRYLDNETLDLVVCNIPGPEKDTDGRAVSCAVQFIGDRSERDLLDCLTVAVISDIHDFEKKFASMFSLRGGLHFKGDQLMEYIDESKNVKIRLNDTLLNTIASHKGEVILFIPSSKNFGVNPDITNKIISELQLPKDTLSQAYCISIDKLESSSTNKMFTNNNSTKVDGSSVNLTHGDKIQEDTDNSSVSIRGNQVIVRGRNSHNSSYPDCSKKNNQQTLFILFGILFAISLIIGIIKFFF